MQEDDMRSIAILSVGALIGVLGAAGVPQEHASGSDGIPPALVAEHHELHQALADAVKSGGRTGEAAREVERVLAPHFEAEEQYALPPLGALAALAAGQPVADRAALIDLSAKLKANLPRMLDEHKAIGEACERLAAAAKDEGKSAAAEFAEHLRHHAAMEEQVMYPAAIVVGDYMKAAGHQ
jgi:hypothetical protein